MNQFKMVVEEFQSRITKLHEYMQHGFKQMQKQFEQVDKRFEQVDKRFEQVDKRFEQVDKRFEQVDKRFDRVDGEIHSMKEQIALLHEGQTEIKAELRQKVSYEEFAKLEKRVTRLEKKTA